MINVKPAEHLTISRYLEYLLSTTPATIDASTPMRITQQPSIEISEVVNPAGENI
jgi:hypothetical protein